MGQATTHGVYIKHSCTLEQNGLLASWRAEGEFVECDDFTTRLDDAGACAGGDAEGAHDQLRCFQHADVIGDSAHNNRDLAVLALHLPA